MKNLMQSPLSLRVSSAALSKAAVFAANNDLRYYLNGVAVMPLEAGGVLAVGTDGHAIICVRDPEGFAKKMTILPISEKRNKSALSEHGTVRMTEDGTIFAERGEVVRFVVPEGEVDGRFPDIKRLFGRPDDYELGIKGSFALPLLQKVAKVGKYDAVRFWTKKAPGLESEHPWGLGLFTIGNYIFGGVMPLWYELKSIEQLLPPDVFLSDAETEVAPPAKDMG